MMSGHIPEALGEFFLIKYYVDYNHAVNMASRRWNCSIIIYVNNSPIIWYGKCQNTFEASSCGLDFVVLMIST